jgi:hypothetical protein
MATRPSIKGSVLSGHVEEVLKQVAAGTIPRAELARRLEPEDMVLLERPIQPSGWYDIRSYTRLLELMRDALGNGSNQYLIDRGALTAERLIQMGLYQQMEYLKRMRLGELESARERHLTFGRDLRLLITITGALLNFGCLQLKEDPEHADRYVIEISDAPAYPDVLGWGTQGFNNRMAAEHGHPDLWRYERLGPDRVRQRMTRSL